MRYRRSLGLPQRGLGDQADGINTATVLFCTHKARFHFLPTTDMMSVVYFDSLMTD